MTHYWPCDHLFITITSGSLFVKLKKVGAFYKKSGVVVRLVCKERSAFVL